MLTHRQETRQHAYRVHRPWVALAVTIGLSGCNSDATALTDPAQTLLTARMNVHAVTIATAPGANTVQLAVSAYRGTGEQIVDAARTFVASDNSLHVTADGLVTGVKVTTKSYVVGRVTYGGVTRSDTTWISVLNATTPAPLTTFRIIAPQNIMAGVTERIPLSAIDANGIDRSAHLPISFSTSDVRVAWIDRYGDLRTLTPERSVTVYARTTVYGVLYEDSVSIAIVYPGTGAFFTVPRRMASGEWVLEFVPNTLWVSAGSPVVFWNQFDGVPNVYPIDVVFETPEEAKEFPNPLFPTGDGNIAPFIQNEVDPFSVAQIRQFTKPGTYRFRSALYGSTGTLIVR